MKKYFLLLVGVALFSSCSNTPSVETDLSKNELIGKVKKVVIKNYQLGDDGSWTDIGSEEFGFLANGMYEYHISMFGDTANFYYEYEDERLVKRADTDDIKGAPEFSFDSQGKLHKVKESTYTIFEYDEQDRLVSEIRHREKTAGVIETKFYIYDETEPSMPEDCPVYVNYIKEGKIVTQKYYSYGELEYTCTFEYSGDDLVSKFYDYTTFQSKSVYGKSNEVVVEEWYADGEKNEGVKRDYKYDDTGNWIEYIYTVYDEYAEEGAEEIRYKTTREISYY